MSSATDLRQALRVQAAAKATSSKGIQMTSQQSPRAARRRRGARMTDLLELFRIETDLTAGSAEADLLDALGNLEILDPDTEEALAKRWVQDGDEAARESFLVSMTARLMRMCLRENNIGEDYLDILNEAVASMLLCFEGLEEFDRKTFRTNALLSVLNVRNRSLVKTTRQVSGPLTLEPRRAMASILRFDFDDVLSGEVSAEEVARTGLQVPGDLDAINRMLDFFRSADDAEAELTVGSHEDEVIHAVDARILPSALEAALDERALDIMRRRWMKDEPEEADDVGRDWDITPERVRQIERQSLRDLKAYFSGGKTDKMIREDRERLKIARRRQVVMSRRTSLHCKAAGVDLNSLRSTMRGPLSPKEYEVISWRYFSGKTVMDLDEVASMCSLGEIETVSEVEAEALKKLRKMHKERLAAARQAGTEGAARGPRRQGNPRAISAMRMTRGRISACEAAL